MVLRELDYPANASDVDHRGAVSWDLALFCALLQ